MNRLKDFKLKVDKKLLGAGAALTCVGMANAQDATDPMASLDNLTTSLTTLNDKTSAIMVGLAVLALTITVGIVVMKITKKGQRAG